MMIPSEVELEYLAEVLASTTLPWLTYAVHTRNAPMVRDVLLELDRQELLALAVVLASRCSRPLMRPDDGIIDQVAVARACAGEPVPLSRLERVAAVGKLAGRGVSTTAIGALLHVSDATVKRLLGQDPAAADDTCAGGAVRKVGSRAS